MALSLCCFLDQWRNDGEGGGLLFHSKNPEILGSSLRKKIEIGILSHRALSMLFNADFPKNSDEGLQVAKAE